MKQEAKEKSKGQFYTNSDVQNHRMQDSEAEAEVKEAETTALVVAFMTYLSERAQFIIYQPLSNIDHFSPWIY